MSTEPIEPPGKAGPTSPVTFDSVIPHHRQQDLGKKGGQNSSDHIKTPGGHCISFFDMDGKACLSITERGGAGIVFGPTGDIQITAHNGAYNIIFGENRMEVTGTHDITVRGGGTLKVDGDYDCTIGGKMNFTTDGDINFTGRNMNLTSRGNMDLVGVNMTVKTEGSAAINSGGGLTLGAEDGVGLTSRTDSVAIAGATQVGIAAAGGEVAIQSGGATHIQAGGDFNLDAPSGVWLNSGKSQSAASTIRTKKATVATSQTYSGPRSENS